VKPASPDEIRSAIVLTFVGSLLVYWELQVPGVVLAPLLMIAVYLIVPQSDK